MIFCYVFLFGLPGSAWAVGSYTSGPLAGGIFQNSQQNITNEGTPQSVHQKQFFKLGTLKSKFASQKQQREPRRRLCRRCRRRRRSLFLVLLCRGRRLPVGGEGLPVCLRDRAQRGGGLDMLDLEVSS